MVVAATIRVMVVVVVAVAAAIVEVVVVVPAVCRITCYVISRTKLSVGLSVN